MTPPEHSLEDPAIDPAEPRQTRNEKHPIGDQRTPKGRLNDPLVLPYPLGQHRGSFEEPAAGLNFFEYYIVVLDRHQTCEEKPATKHAFAGLPCRGEFADVRREGHAEERAKLAVHS